MQLIDVSIWRTSPNKTGFHSKKDIAFKLCYLVTDGFLVKGNTYT